MRNLKMHVFGRIRKRGVRMNFVATCAYIYTQDSACNFDHISQKLNEYFEMVLSYARQMRFQQVYALVFLVAH